ncbi:MAG: glutamate-5-semialdehyde dehydrogenase [Pirellulales bacterium]|nr:glutamate-5-semialdehyde dehydrogenase [Pirellulales bacterium]
MESIEMRDYCLDVARRARAAAVELVRAKSARKVEWLWRAADLLREQSDSILAANRHDVAAAPGFGLSNAEIDRLTLTPERLQTIAKALEDIAALTDPVGEVIESTVRPNGLKISKVRVPLGVVLFIYESRPNVTSDAAAICVKSGNAVILRGGKEAAHSSQAIVDLLRQALNECQLPVDAVQLVKTADRAAVGCLLQMHDLIDLAIPRGGEGLIRRVAEEATMPVIKHFTGNCHVYIDRAADLAIAERIAVNAKCQRMGVCNAAESLLVHSGVVAEFLPRIGAALDKQGVEIRGDESTRTWIASAKPATEADFKAEYLGPIISCRVVESLDEAIEHVNRYGSHHTDAIVTGDPEAAKQFAEQVDSAAVMVNASTRFNDGGEFGLGAEIGISTDKFHARGPCGLKELTSYKYVVIGEGHVRE